MPAMLAAGVDEVFGGEGIGGPTDSLGLTLGGGGYGFAAVPDRRGTADESMTTGYHGPVTFLTRATAPRFGLRGDYALVEVVLNCGNSGTSPASVITRLRRLDGTPRFRRPLDDVMRELVAAQRARERSEAAALAALVDPLRPRHPSAGPLRVSDVPGFEWVNDRARLTIRTRAVQEEHNNGCGAPTAQPCHLLSTRFGYELRTTWDVAPDGRVTRVAAAPPTVIDEFFPPPP